VMWPLLYAERRRRLHMDRFRTEQFPVLLLHVGTVRLDGGLGTCIRLRRLSSRWRHVSPALVEIVPQLVVDSQTPQLQFLVCH